MLPFYQPTAEDEGEDGGAPPKEAPQGGPIDHWLVDVLSRPIQPLQLKQLLLNLDFEEVGGELNPELEFNKFSKTTTPPNPGLCSQPK